VEFPTTIPPGQPGAGQLQYSTPNDREKYATYARDSATGLDYAVNRYYASTWGRFVSPDPYRGSMELEEPGSLNRYAYAWNDPINSNDPTGLCIVNGEVFPDPCFSITATGRTSSSPYTIGLGVNSPAKSFMQALQTASRAEYLADQAGTQRGGGFQAAQGAFRRAAQDLAKKNFKQPCNDDLAALGTNAAAVRTGAGKAAFLYGVGNTATMASLYASSPVASVRQAARSLTGTVGSYIASHTGVVAVAQLGGSNIYLNPSLINTTDYFQNISIVLHEVLHNVTGLTDPDMQRALRLSTSEISDNITQRLRKDCF
jgi:RHS repeat-associated protein